VAGLLGLDKAFRTLKQSAITNVSNSIEFGNGAFTPRNLGDSNPIFTDRPYASILYVSFKHAMASEEKGWLVGSELTVGALGLSIAKRVQTFIHRTGRRNGWLTREDPLGWSHQISNGCEPTVRYRAGGMLRLAKKPFYDFTTTGEATLGYYTGAAFGGLLRVGKISSPPWSTIVMPISVASQGISYHNNKDDIMIWWKKLDAYLYASGRTRFVGYNALLQGQFRHSDVMLSASQVERVVEEFELGAALSGLFREIMCVPNLNFTAAFLSGRTPEYSIPGVAPRTHLWGGVYINWERQI
jgi:hypothetical protein